ncbi:MAG: hypothetical protein JEZ05_06765 [Tenericutes bacterium]|nr:hypothetical protein [Mycoplasmatota bacterium]
MMKLYYRYIFSKKIILVFILINIIFIVSQIYSSGLMDGFTYMDMYRFDFQEMFYSDFVLMVKIVSVTFNVFMVTLIFKDSCVNMSKYIVDKPIKKLVLIWAKLLIVFEITFTVVFLLFEYFGIIHVFLTPYSYSLSEFVNLFLAVLLMNISYVLISFFLMSLIASMLTIVLPILLFWYMELNVSITLIEEKSLAYIFYQYIPNISLNQGEYLLSNHFLNYLFFDIVLISLIVFLNIKKEIL